VVFDVILLIAAMNSIRNEMCVHDILQVVVGIKTWNVLLFCCST